VFALVYRPTLYLIDLMEKKSVNSDGHKESPPKWPGWHKLESK
jgi:hypothetical protein